MTRDEALWCVQTIFGLELKKEVMVPKMMELDNG